MHQAGDPEHRHDELRGRCFRTSLALTTRLLLLTVVLFAWGSSMGSAQPPIAIEWSLGPDMLQATAGGMTGIIDETLIVAGGTFWHTKQTKRFVKWTQLYDTATGTWRMGPDLPHEVAYAFNTVVDNRLYAFGGCGQDGEATTEGYILTRVANPEEGQPQFEWSSGPSFPQPAVFTVGGALDDVIYAIGVANYSLTKISNTLYALDTHNLDAGWKQLPSMPGPPTTLFAATTCGDALYVFGGYRTDRDPPYSVDNAYKYDVTTSEWTRIRRLPFDCHAQTALACDDRYIIIFGPYLNSAEETRIHGSDHGNSGAVLLYDTQQDTYQPLQPMPFAVVEVFFGLKDNVLYGAGGEHLYKIRSLQSGNRTRW